jgi:hypothetical protein
MGRDAERDRDPDDWFAEPDTSGVQPRRAASVETDSRPAAPDALSDDWLEPDARTRAGGGPLPATTKIGIAAVALVVALVVGLLVSGVFDSGSTPSTPPTATRSTTTRPATSASKTTPASSALPVPTAQLATGDKGPAVTLLQRALARAGYPVGTVDGQYGPATKSAVAQFQASEHLTADGIAGMQTLTALNAKLNGP